MKGLTFAESMRSPKRFILLLFIAFSMLFFCEDVKGGYFEKVYGHDAGTSGSFFARTSDHGLIILGDALDSVPHSGYYLLKVDSDGIVQWEKKIIDAFDAFSYSITTLNDGRIVLLGTHTGVVYQIVAEVMVFDSAGNFLNAAVYPPFNGWGTAGISMTNSGDSSVSIILYNDGFISNNYYSVFSLNTDLSTRWSDFVGFDGSFTQSHGITSSLNGHLYTLSYYEEYFYSTIPAFRVTHIREHRNDGTLRLDSIYEFNCVTNAIYVTADSGAVICGTQDTAVQKDIQVIRIDSSGNVLWQKQFGSRLDEESNAIIQTKDHGFAVLSTIADSVIPGQHDLLLMKISENGDSLWSRQFGGTLNETGLHLEEENTDLVMMGATNSFNDDHIYVVRTDSMGLLELPYMIDFSGRYYCEGDTATLHISPPVPPGSHITWSNGDTINPVRVTQTGNYFAIVTDSDGVSFQTPVTPVYFSAQPNAHFGLDTLRLCSGTALTDTAEYEPVNMYQWFYNDTLLAGETNPYLTPQLPGNYQLVVSNYCTSDTGTSYLDTLYDLPAVPVITSPSVDFVCAGDSLPISISGIAGETYQWYMTDNIMNTPIAGENDTTYYVHETGWYLVEATNVNGCSVFSWSYPVFYDLAQEFIDPNGPTHFCKGGEVVLSMANGSNFLWSNGQTTQAITVNSAGDYFVFFINENNCPKISDTVSITVFNNPLVNIGADTTSCSSDSILLDAGPGYNNYVWSDGSANQTLFAFSAGPFPDTTEYNVTVIDTNGCTNGDTISILFDICIDIEELPGRNTLIFPNPVMHGEKLSFVGIGLSAVSIKLTDVLGKEVFLLESIQGNGFVIPGEIVPGVYFYTIFQRSALISAGKLIVN